jgi:hypothetical protein
LSFQDVTEKAGVGGNGEWCNAASVVDINQDGLEDIYVCTTVKKNAAQRTNLLYINEGKDKDGVPVFKERAKEYGLCRYRLVSACGFFDL